MKAQSMIPKFLIKLGAIIASAVTLLLVNSTRADTPAFVLGNVSGSPSSFTGTRGWQFGIANPNGILITQLGVFDNGSDGLVNPHQIGLWRRDPGNLTGTLLESATVPAGTEAPLFGGYRWISITPVRIPYELGFYVIGAQYSAGDADDLVTPLAGPRASDIYIDIVGRTGVGPDLPFPASSFRGPCPECPGPIFWEPNLQFVVIPEPSVWLLLTPALCYLFLRPRKRN